jgi:RimJ/RimL family protein N-acetyltransferase
MLPYIAIDFLGLRLHQMRDTDSETVRLGRNHSFVRQNHFYKEIITPEQHEVWYQQICQTRDYYFIISKDAKPLGMFYLKDITPGLISGHTGFFIWEEKALHTRIPMLATIFFAEFFFFAAGLQNMEAIVHAGNNAMLNIAHFFRYQIFREDSNDTVRILGTHANYLVQRDRLLNFGRRLSRDPTTWKLRIEGEKDPSHHPEILRLIS